MKPLGLSPTTVYVLALAFGIAISWISTRWLKAYCDYEERQNEGRVLPGRFPRDGLGGMR